MKKFWIGVLVGLIAATLAVGGYIIITETPSEEETPALEYSDAEWDARHPIIHSGQFAGFLWLEAVVLRQDRVY